MDYSKYRVVGLILEPEGYPLQETPEVLEPLLPPVEFYDDEPASPYEPYEPVSPYEPDSPRGSDVGDSEVHPFLDFEHPADDTVHDADEEEDDTDADPPPPSPDHPPLQKKTYIEGVDYLDSHIGSRSIHDNTSRRYLRDLFRQYYKKINKRLPTKLVPRLPTETDKTSKEQGVYYNIFVDKLKNEIYPEHNITVNVMTKHGKNWRIDPSKFAENGIEKLPLWMDIAIDRRKSGVPVSQTAQQKEALGSNCACHHCGWRLGEKRGPLILAPRNMHFDGVSEEHKKRKYHGRAPSGQVTASMEVAADDVAAVFSCLFCHASRSNTHWMDDIKKKTKTTPSPELRRSARLREVGRSDVRSRLRYK